MLKYIALVMLSAALCCCAPARSKPLAKPEAVPIQGDFIHEASGMRFPVTVGEFERSSLRRKDTHGLDVSARYDFLSMAVSVAVILDIYPAPRINTDGMPSEMVVAAQENMSQQEFEVRRREIMSAHNGAILVQEGDVSSPKKDQPSLGKMAVFEYADTFLRERQVLRSQLYLYCYAGGEWVIKYQFTYPKNADASQEIENFMANLPWTLKKSDPLDSKK